MDHYYVLTRQFLKEEMNESHFKQKFKEKLENPTFLNTIASLFYEVANPLFQKEFELECEPEPEQQPVFTEPSSSSSSSIPPFRRGSVFKRFLPPPPTPLVSDKIYYYFDCPTLHCKTYWFLDSSLPRICNKCQVLVHPKRVNEREKQNILLNRNGKDLSLKPVYPPRPFLVPSRHPPPLPPLPPLPASCPYTFSAQQPFVLSKVSKEVQKEPPQVTITTTTSLSSSQLSPSLPLFEPEKKDEFEPETVVSPPKKEKLKTPEPSPSKKRKRSRSRSRTPTRQKQVTTKKREKMKPNIPEKESDKKEEVSTNVFDLFSD